MEFIKEKKKLIIIIACVIFISGTIIGVLCYKNNKPVENTNIETEEIVEESSEEVEEENSIEEFATETVKEPTLEEIKAKEEAAKQEALKQETLKKAEEEKQKKIAEEKAKEREATAIKKQEKRDYFGTVYLEKVDSNSYLYDLIYDYLAYLPKNVINAFHNSGYTITISSDHINTKYAGMTGSIQGITLSKTKQIFIDNREVAVRNATLHEMGHAIDTILGWTSHSNEWGNIFNAERNKLVVHCADNYYKSDVQEYFAEAFQEALLNPTTCKNSAPQTYEYIMRVMQSL